MNIPCQNKGDIRNRNYECMLTLSKNKVNIHFQFVFLGRLKEHFGSLHVWVFSNTSIALSGMRLAPFGEISPKVFWTNSLPLFWEKDQDLDTDRETPPLQCNPLFWTSGCEIVLRKSLFKEWMAWAMWLPKLARTFLNPREYLELLCMVIILRLI